jgi:exopolyphosphatase/guanosine-5'-triphosphate,3'-diphosphate pyrophosphatase
VVVRQKAKASDPAPGFPLRVGVVDMGSNAIRLMAAEFIAPATYTELLYDRVPIRLGHRVYESGRIDPETIEATVRTMMRFRDVFDELAVEHVRAVATSAVRESENGRDLAKRIQKEAGLRLEIITGVEEARLVYWALKSRIELGKEPWLLADLGGGSLEIALVDDVGLHESRSYTIGSVRLYEEFEEAAGDLKRFRTLLHEYLGGLHIPSANGRAAPQGFFATGGNMEDLAQLVRAKSDDRGVSVVPLKDLEGVIEKLGDLTVEQRIEKLGLREDRADVILPAAMVYAHLARMADLDAIHVPHVGVKEGVMFDMVDDLVTHAGYTKRHRKEVLSGAVALGRRFSFDESHGVQVSRLAENLYDQLEEVHELDGQGREILLAAAMLHDVGQVISYTRHHKHSYYLLRESELPGFQPEDILLIATVARYHRKAHPSEKHEEFAMLDDDQRKLVVKLAAMLRVADALDREHQARVKSVEVKADEVEVVLSLGGDGDFALERWALARKAALFEETFRRKVRTADGEKDADD